MNAKEIIILICEFNVVITLTARKNRIKIQKFKTLTMFEMIFERNKKILKSNDFWIKNVATTAILRCERFKIMMHEIKVKSMLKNKKSEDAKVIKRINVIMHSKLQIKKMKWLVKKNEKKKYAFMMTWIRDAKIVNKLIQLSLIIKSNIKTIKYYKKNCKIK